MTRLLPDQLRDAANNVRVASIGDIAALLRRAASRIENANTLVFEPMWDAALMSVAVEMNLTRDDAIGTSFRSG